MRLKRADGVANNGGVGMADVGQAVRVVDRRGQIVFFFFLGHRSFSKDFCDACGHAARPGLLRPLAHGFFHHLLERDILLLCQFTAIVKLWRSLTDDAVEASDLYANFAKAGGNRLPIARQNATFGVWERTPSVVVSAKSIS